MNDSRGEGYKTTTMVGENFRKKSMVEEECYDDRRQRCRHWERGEGKAFWKMHIILGNVYFNSIATKSHNSILWNAYHT